MRRQRPCPYYYGRQLWMVTREFFGCGITEGMVEDCMLKMLNYYVIGCI